MVKPLKSVSNDLWWDKTGLIARKWLLRGLVAAGIALPSLAFAQTDSKPAPQKQTLSEIFNKNAINDAIKDFAHIAKTTQTNYSKELQAEQKRLTRFARKDAPYTYQITVMDPLKTDIGTALGLPLEQIMQKTFPRRISQSMDSTAKAVVGQIMRVKSTYDTKDTTYTQDPMTYTANRYQGQSQKTFIAPMPLYGIELGPAHLTHAQMKEFTNRHEGWHSVDWRNDRKDLPADSIDVSHLHSTYTWLNDYYTRERGRSFNQGESLADVGALGDMIRSGHDAKIIDAAILWRNDTGGDFAHTTQPALVGLKAEINRIGIDAFRKMKDIEAAHFYAGIITEYTLNSEEMVLFLKYDQAINYDAYEDFDARADGRKKSQEYIKEFNSRADVNSSYKKAHSYVGYMLNIPDFPDIPAERLKMINEALDGFDPMSTLINDAYSHDKSVTPKTLIAAYARVQDSLLKQKADEPANADIHDAKLVRLQKTFTQGLTKVDYAAENTSRGIKLKKSMLQEQRR